MRSSDKLTHPPIAFILVKTNAPEWWLGLSKSCFCLSQGDYFIFGWIIPLLHENVQLFNNSTFLSQKLVDDLYSFRDRYFETHSVEDAGRKQNDVAQEMEKTLERLEEKEGGH